MISLTSPVETRAHGWSAGAKLGALCVATVVLFAVKAPFWHLTFAGATLVLYALPGRAFFREGLLRVLRLWPFAVLVLVWHGLTGDLSQGLVVALRMFAAVGLANLVTMTTRLSQFMEVIRWLAAPLRAFGINTRAIELAVALVVRFTPVLADKGQALGQAWRARAASRPRWRILHPFMLLAVDDAEHVAEALRARGGL